MRPGMGHQRWGWVGNGAAKRGWTHGPPGFMPNMKPPELPSHLGMQCPTPSVPLDQPLQQSEG